ncbi:MAG TPA: hypothetical protein VGC10_04830 [Sphingomonas sp.]
MTDGSLNIADLIASGDEELMFDDDDEIVFEPLPAHPPEPEPEPAKPRRATRRGRAAVGGEAAAQAEPAIGSAAPPAPVPAPAAARPAPEERIPPSAAAVPVAAEEPAGPPAPVPQPDVGPAGFDRRNALLIAIVVLALFTSILSLGGLIAVGRTIAHAEADRARAQEERDVLARVPAIVKTLDDATAKLAIAAGRTPGGPPATADDLKRALDDLRLSLAQHQPDGLTPLSGITRDGFIEIGVKLDRLSSQIAGVRAAPVASRPLSPVGQ